MAHTTTTGEATGRSGPGKVSAEMQRCIDVCVECHRICLETVATCLEMGGKHAAPEHIRLLMDCAQICDSSADFMIRGSDLHHLTCAACSEICRACADSCRQLGGPEMQRCADVCERCAESCAQMAGQAGAH